MRTPFYSKSLSLNYRNSDHELEWDAKFLDIENRKINRGIIQWSG